jgi:hypothetical protein
VIVVVVVNGSLRDQVSSSVMVIRKTVSSPYLRRIFGIFVRIFFERRAREK